MNVMYTIVVMFSWFFGYIDGKGSQHCTEELHLSVRNTSLAAINLTYFHETRKLMEGFVLGELPANRMWWVDGKEQKKTEIQFSFAVAANSCVKTICTIGLKPAGDSTLLFLTAAPNANIVIFVLWNHRNAMFTAQFLRDQSFLNASSRMRFVYCDSRSSISDFAMDSNFEGCDLLSVEESLSYEDTMENVASLGLLARHEWHALLMDDVTCDRPYDRAHVPCVDSLINELERRGTVHVIKRAPAWPGGDRKGRELTLLHYNIPERMYYVRKDV